jgi:hypothetical protein
MARLGIGTVGTAVRVHTHQPQPWQPGAALAHPLWRARSQPASNFRRWHSPTSLRHRTHSAYPAGVSPDGELMPVQMQTFHLLSSNGLVKQIFHPRMTHENHLTLRPPGLRVVYPVSQWLQRAADFSTSQPQNGTLFVEGAKGRGSV